jgi:hypothetical protein
LKATLSKVKVMVPRLKDMVNKASPMLPFFKVMVSNLRGIRNNLLAMARGTRHTPNLNLLR